MLLLYVLATVFSVASADYIAPLQHDMRCKGCDLVADSIYKELLKVYRKTKGETILVGHRMQKNSKNVRKKKYFGSEAMAEDVIEGVCTRVSNLGDDLLGKGHPMGAKEVLNYENSLENYCETIIEEHAESLKEKLFNKEIMKPKGVNKWLCIEKAEICTAQYFETQKELKEKAEQEKDEDEDEAGSDSGSDGAGGGKDDV